MTCNVEATLLPAKQLVLVSLAQSEHAKSDLYIYMFPNYICLYLFMYINNIYVHLILITKSFANNPKMPYQ